ncbi:hypothetical protein [Acinetobacter sp. CFCC 10889]|uniref:hypothetical protein n=1 Tax=Acinetobacter sp. CFCC 10889 TaxID=1775557 RepID=UPI000DCFA159|nr:hypothetical protein [Acinetobacter sp. CFCC 10889]
MKIGVPYADALKMPKHLALALLEGLHNGRQHNTRSVNQAPPSPSQGKRRIATRRKSQES